MQWNTCVLRKSITGIYNVHYSASSLISEFECFAFFDRILRCFERKPPRPLCLDVGIVSRDSS